MRPDAAPTADAGSDEQSEHAAGYDSKASWLNKLAYFGRRWILFIKRAARLIGAVTFQEVLFMSSATLGS